MATGIVAMVCVLTISTTISERKLVVSLARMQQVKSAISRSTQPPAPQEPTAIAATDNVAPLLWPPVIEHIEAWLSRMSYSTQSLLFPNVQDSRNETALPLPAAPEPLLQEIRAAARFTPEPVSLTQHIQFANAAVLLAEQAKREMGASNYESAVRDLVLTLRIADMTMAAPNLVQLERRRRLYGIVQNVVMRVPLKLHVIQPLIDQLSRAGGKTVLTALLMDDLEVRLAQEAAWKQRGFTASVKDAGLYWGTRNWLWMSPVCRPLQDHDQQTNVEVTLRLVELAAKPIADIRADLIEIESQMAPSKGAFWNENESWLIRRRLFAIIDSADFESRVNIMRLGLALNAYYAQTGTFAPDLATACAILGETVPTDPFTGVPYHYDLRARGYMVYSEGQKNDGGGPAWAYYLPSELSKERPVTP